MLIIEDGVIPKPLRDVIGGRRCTVYIGSGVSREIYGDWVDLVNLICTRCGVARRVTNASTSEDFLGAAQEAKEANPAAYFSGLGEHFGRPANYLPSVYDALLSLPFASYLTVNLDPTFAIRAIRQTPPLDVHVFPALDRRAMDKPAVFHLHGLVREREVPVEGSVVLAQGEFEEAYGDNRPLLRFMLQTFEEDPVVFIGCRLREPPMARVFEICKRDQQNRRNLIARSGERPSEPPPRFILLGVNLGDEVGVGGTGVRGDALMQDQEQYYQGLGVQPVWYRVSGDDHSELRKALEDLARFRGVEVSRGWGG